ncbi:hypothetical protein C3F09_08845 [candidate division GN15 bacterium]|uniref:DUF2087 domain-containing protein n=1 Tax=candidate division GN15 bacterium TaxID=2072418 RepID=A0A855X423_9BACT|nr:MAG: hypothetical protein C3F09_08845 [candidate division GN15 bacterium]
MLQITTSRFTARFITLVLKGNGMPRKQEDRHILFLSALLGLESGREYTETQLNEQLRQWSDQFGDNVGLDHVSLRRSLVDEHFLARDAAGKGYTFRKENLPYTLDSAIWSLNLTEVIDHAKMEIEERKRLHQKDGK